MQQGLKTTVRESPFFQFSHSRIPRHQIGRGSRFSQFVFIFVDKLERINPFQKAKEAQSNLAVACEQLALQIF